MHQQAYTIVSLASTSLAWPVLVLRASPVLSASAAALRLCPLQLAAAPQLHQLDAQVQSIVSMKITHLYSSLAL